MKRQKKKTKPRKKTPVDIPGTEPPAKRNMSRRHVLGNAVIYSIGIAALGGGTWHFAHAMTLSARESDLSTIGNGVPAIVQIHDPTCPTCNALRCEAREAACGFDEGSLQFRVASLHTDEGREMAARHGVGKITLLLFDGQGNMRGSLPGLNTANDLKSVFADHLSRYGGADNDT